MADTSLEVNIFFVVGLVFLALGLGLLLLMVINTQPYEKIALANTDKIASAMNDACFRNVGEDDPVVISFNLPQTKPGFASRLVDSDKLPFFPTFLMNFNGDPNFILYYETFPPGEAIGWEVYNDFGNRVIIQIPDDVKEVSGLASYIQSVKNTYNTEIDDRVPDAYIVNNLRIGEISSDNIGEIGIQLQPAGGYKQINKKDTDDRIYEFIGYLSYDTINKSAPKYMSCGDGNLCLKTRSFVKSIPLDRCTANNYNYIMLVDNRETSVEWSSLATRVMEVDLRDAAYSVIASGPVAAAATVATLVYGPAKGVKFVWKAGGTVAKGLWRLGVGMVTTRGGRAVTVGGLTLLLSAELKDAVLGDLSTFSKKSDFNLASPCTLGSGQMEIFTSDCKNGQYKCDNIHEYNLYKLDGNNLVEDKSSDGDGKHIACLDNMLTSYQGESAGEVKCLVVRLKGYVPDYCSMPAASPVADSTGYYPQVKGYNILSPSEFKQGFLSSLTKNIVGFHSVWMWPGALL